MTMRYQKFDISEHLDSPETIRNIWRSCWKQVVSRDTNVY
jgi:hypothetical protein